VSPTSGLMQQIEFCKRIVAIFRDQPFEVILSLSASQDKLSAFDPALLTNVPLNIHINRVSGNFEIMPEVDIYIGQAGQGGTLEAIYCGVPQILFPPIPYHNVVASRVVELGLGTSLAMSELSQSTLIIHVNRSLKDESLSARVQHFRQLMLSESGAQRSADIIEEYISRRRSEATKN